MISRVAPAIAQGAYKSEHEALYRTGISMRKRMSTKKTVAKETPKKVAPAKQKPTRGAPEDMDALTPGDLADALKIDPKKVRAKLRTLSLPKEFFTNGDDTRWYFDPAKKSEIIKLLEKK